MICSMAQAEATGTFHVAWREPGFRKVRVKNQSILTPITAQEANPYSTYNSTCATDAFNNNYLFLQDGGGRAR